MVGIVNNYHQFKGCGIINDFEGNMYIFNAADVDRKIRRGSFVKFRVIKEDGKLKAKDIEVKQKLWK